MREPGEPLRLYACWCGTTLCLEQCQILECCEAKDPVARQWKAWEKGLDRCPYCVTQDCPYDWHAICDCGMAPYPADDHTCEECMRWRFQDDGMDQIPLPPGPIELR